MKLEHAKEICETCSEFMSQVINKDELQDYDCLCEKIRQFCANSTEHDDDTIDIDYKKMCFTVHMTKNGDWALCENASYYIMDSGFLDTVDGVIDVELF